MVNFNLKFKILQFRITVLENCPVWKAKQHVFTIDDISLSLLVSTKRNVEDSGPDTPTVSTAAAAGTAVTV